MDLNDTQVGSQTLSLVTSNTPHQYYRARLLVTGTNQFCAEGAADILHLFSGLSAGNDGLRLDPKGHRQTLALRLHSQPCPHTLKPDAHARQHSYPQNQGGSETGQQGGPWLCI